MPPATSAAKFVDLQVNGFGGVDFQQPDLTLVELEHAMRILHSHATPQILLTLITDSVDALCAKLEQLESFRASSSLVASTIVGYHLEGPHLLPEPGFHGPHPPHLMCAPNVPDFERLYQAAGGQLRLVTLAPEWPGSPEVIAHMVARDVKVAIGHSNADDRAIDQAIAAGLTLCTHLGNGVPPHLHRHDNVVQRLLARDELTAVFIPDGIHLPPAVLQNFVRAKPRGKVLFTTDAMAAAGAPPGRYAIGPAMVEVGEDRIVRNPGSDQFAGSALTMDEAAHNVVHMLGWSAEDAIAACSGSVSAALGLAPTPAN